VRRKEGFSVGGGGVVSLGMALGRVCRPKSGAAEENHPTSTVTTGVVALGCVGDFRGILLKQPSLAKGEGGID